MKITSNTEVDSPEHQQLWQTASEPWIRPILPSGISLAHARSSFLKKLPQEGYGLEDTRSHLSRDIVPALNANSLSANYYGFVTGGVTPAALFADQINAVYDQNVQVHLPEQTIATDLEHKALDLLVDLLNLDRSEWSGGTFTTGATASNIQGLAIGREHILELAARKAGFSEISVGEHGIFEVMKASEVTSVQVLTSLAHSSMAKAASIVGFGRKSIKSVCVEGSPVKIDFELLEEYCAAPNTATIVALSAGEVNTGHFDTANLSDFQKIRAICDKYNAWIHVDGAFAMFATILSADKPEYRTIRASVEGFHLADSITGDCHKFLNVAYDCGFFLTRHPDLQHRVFQNANAAYLSSGATAPTIPSPLNIGLENSRRFRALPVYATLRAYGRSGHVDMMERHVNLARAVTSYLLNESVSYEVLSPGSTSNKEIINRTSTIVLFRAREPDLNKVLVAKINATGRIYVSPTSWEEKPAARIAVSNWRVDVDRDLKIIREVLESIAESK